jgi:CRP/FNR family transcriptional regulator
MAGINLGLISFLYFSPMSAALQLHTAIRQIHPGVTDAELDAFEPLLKYRNIAKGEYFYRAGDKQPYIGFINKGLIRCFYINDAGEEINTRFVFENDYATDYDAYLAQTKGESNMMALEDTALVLIGYKEFMGVIESSRTWERFARLIAEDVIQRTEKHYSNHFKHTPEQRYLELLKTNPDIMQRVPLYHIATFLGIKRESLSRIRKRVAAQRL